MTPDERRVADLVRSAFRGVSLGNGVGLLQGQGLDGCASLETVAVYRSKDEQDDWSRIRVEALNECCSSLPFFDAEGMRFHLPAYLIADLEDTLDQETLEEDITFHLTCLDNWGAMSRFANLNEAQRHAVREFLLIRWAHPHREVERALIARALADYWTES